MTTQELRELDAWIAEHVMGWTVINDTLCDPKPEVRNGMQTGDVDMNPVADLPHYTTDPSTAMDVLKKCAEKIPSITISWCQYVPRNHGWVIGSPQCSFDLVKAETLELAICLFSKQIFTK